MISREASELIPSFSLGGSQVLQLASFSCREAQLLEGQSHGTFGF